MSERTYSAAYFETRDASPLFTFELNVLAQGLASHRVLEVGCGAGRLGERLRQEGVTSYIGTDVVQQPGASPDLLCDASHIPVRRASIDAVVSQHVVEHLEDPMMFFAEAKRLLTPGGVMRFTTPNALYPRPDLFDDPTHNSVHSAQWWRSALSDAGFVGIRLRTLFPYLGHPILLYPSARLSRVVRSVGRIGFVIFAEACTRES